VPHAVRLLFGEDVRVILPCSFLLGAAFLMLADAVARTVLGRRRTPRRRDHGARGRPRLPLAAQAAATFSGNVKSRDRRSEVRGQ
jgi:hypothetical protein